jgi:hypothetical protein
VVVGGLLVVRKLLGPRQTESEVLLARLNRSMRSLEAIDVPTKTEKDLRNELHDRKDWDELDAQSRMMGAQYLVFMSAQSDADPNEETQDMEKAWELVSGLTEDQAASMDSDSMIMRNLLRIDIAYRLQDGTRLLQVFNEIYARGQQMREEELLCCLEVACVLGQWKAMRFIGSYLDSSHNPLFIEQYAADSVTNSTKDFLYFKSVYNLSSSEASMQDDSEVTTLQWTSFTILSMESRLTECKNFAPGEERATREGFEDAEGNPEWKLSEGFNGVLEVTGALGKLETRNNITVAGPCSDSEILLQGSQCIMMNEQLVRRTERWELGRDPTDTTGQAWHGTMTIQFEGSYGGPNMPFQRAPQPGESGVEIKSPDTSVSGENGGESTVTDSTATFDLRVKMTVAAAE